MPCLKIQDKPNSSRIQSLEVKTSKFESFKKKRILKRKKMQFNHKEHIKLLNG